MKLAISGDGLNLAAPELMKRPPYAAFFLLAVLMFMQAATGLAFPWVYRDSQAWMLAAWKGNDVVTLLAAAPALAVSTQWARRGSARGLLLAIGLLAFALYNDTYYLLGAQLSRAFPLYVAIAIVSVMTLATTLSRVNARHLALLSSSRTPRKSVGTFLVVMGGGLGTLWLLQWAMFVLTGKVPAVGLQAFQLIAALDLTMLCTLFIAGGVLLWKRSDWASVVAPMACVVGATYALVLLAGTFAGLREGLPGMREQLPLWGVLFGSSAIAAWLLLQEVEARPRDPWFWSSRLHG